MKRNGYMQETQHIQPKTSEHQNTKTYCTCRAAGIYMDIKMTEYSQKHETNIY